MDRDRKLSQRQADSASRVSCSFPEEEASTEQSSTADSVGSYGNGYAYSPDNPPMYTKQKSQSAEPLLSTALYTACSSEPKQQAESETKTSKTLQSPSQPLFYPQFVSTRFLQRMSKILLMKNYSDHDNSTWIGFWALLTVTCGNYVLTPMRDAVALAVGVNNLPKLTLASTLLAVLSSVPIGWLFEAPDPNRRRLWKRMGLTRGETQGTSLALFYRCFAISLLSYSVGFWLFRSSDEPMEGRDPANRNLQHHPMAWWIPQFAYSLLKEIGQVMYVAFFLVVHLMKLHSLSLIWGVTTETIEYEDIARKRTNTESKKTRLERMAFVGFGGTLGGILGSAIASSCAHTFKLSGLLLVAAFLLEQAAQLSIELGRIMQKHWEQQQLLLRSSEDLASLDTSIKRSASLGSMKRVASGNSLNRIRSLSELNGTNQSSKGPPVREIVDDSSFTQRLLRGITTILRSRLLMAIFTYNALYASTTVLLSFQRAKLVAARNTSSTTESDTAFLANINMASSVAVFCLQASGIAALIAQKCGSTATLSLMPLIRLLGVLSLAWWHRNTDGKPPNLILFLLLDECTRVVNLAIAKPVRESLWRGLSNEARYEAKPIVDTLANRWGGGSAAFLVSFTDKMFDLFGVQNNRNGSQAVFGCPPVLFLCIIIAAWWAMVSADLGQIRRRIDLELKKRQ